MLVAEQIMGIKAVTDLAKEIGNFFVVGGVVRRAINCGNILDCDIDIISPIWEPWEVVKEKANGFVAKSVSDGGDGSKYFRFAGREFNVMAMKKSITSSIAEFDFTCCQAALDTATGSILVNSMSSVAIEDAQRKAIVPTEWLLKTANRGLSLRRWCRAAKLMGEGYTLSQEMYLKMAESYKKLHCPYMDHGPSMSDEPVVDF